MSKHSVHIYGSADAHINNQKFLQLQDEDINETKEVEEPKAKAPPLRLNKSRSKKDKDKGDLAPGTPPNTTPKVSPLPSPRSQGPHSAPSTPLNQSLSQLPTSPSSSISSTSTSTSTSTSPSSHIPSQPHSKNSMKGNDKAIRSSSLVDFLEKANNKKQKHPHQLFQTGDNISFLPVPVNEIETSNTTVHNGKGSKSAKSTPSTSPNTSRRSSASGKNSTVTTTTTTTTITPSITTTTTSNDFIIGSYRRNDFQEWDEALHKMEKPPAVGLRHMAKMAVGGKNTNDNTKNSGTSSCTNIFKKSNRGDASGSGNDTQDWDDALNSMESSPTLGLKHVAANTFFTGTFDIDNDTPEYRADAITQGEWDETLANLDRVPIRGLKQIASDSLTSPINEISSSTGSSLGNSKSNVDDDTQAEWENELEKVEGTGVGIRQMAINSLSNSSSNTDNTEHVPNRRSIKKSRGGNIIISNSDSADDIPRSTSNGRGTNFTKNTGSLHSSPTPNRIIGSSSGNTTIINNANTSTSVHSSIDAHVDDDKQSNNNNNISIIYNYSNSSSSN